MSDGNLRQIFRKHLPSVHWQSIETIIGRGTPDINGCLNGKEFWIENKSTSGWAVKFEEGQVAWHEQRLRAGGRVFLAVRRAAIAGPRRGAAVDELWLFSGSHSRSISLCGLKGARPLAAAWQDGGPARWDWEVIKKELMK